MGTLLCLSANFSKGDKFSDFLFGSLENDTLLKQGLLKGKNFIA